MNTKALKCVADYIVKEPKGYNQSVFIGASSETACGTECCIAGTAVMLDNPRAYLRLLNSEPSVNTSPTVEQYARAILGLTPNQADRLFSTGDYWPEPFASRYEKARSPRQLAKVAADRIAYFIRTGK